ncbi:MAG: DUF4252 domain-containing protein [Acidobacteriota bacterium]
MKSTLQTSLKLASLVLLLIAGLAMKTQAQTARLNMAQLDYLGAKASETVDVNIDERLMQLTAKFLSGKDPDEVKVKELVNGLKGIYVKSFEFERENEYSQTDVESIRTQLKAPGWSRVVNVTSKREGSVEVYLMTTASQVGGLVVVATDPKELTIVNIVGPVDLEKLSDLEGNFGVPELGIESTKPKKK